MYYWDGFGSLMKGLFTQIAPNAIPLAKQLSMKAMGLIGENVSKPIDDLVGSITSSIKVRITG